MKRWNLDDPVTVLTGEEFLPKEGFTFAQQVYEFFVSQGGVAQSPWGEVLLDIILPLDYYATGGKKQMTGMIAAPILIGTDTFICVVVIIYNLRERRLYLHETFLTEKIPEIAASSLVRGGDSPKILSK